MRNKGLRVYGGRIEPFELPWPELAEFPPYGLVRARRATSTRSWPTTRSPAGARLLRGRPTSPAPILDDRTDRIVGVTHQGRPQLPRPDRGRRGRQLVPAGARRWGWRSATDRPMGVAVRTYFTSPAHATTTTWSPGWNCGTASRGESNLLPGYGWIFGMGDGTVQRRPRHGQLPSESRPS